MPNRFSPFKQFREDLLKDPDYISRKKETVILPFHRVPSGCQDKQLLARQARVTAQIPNPTLVTPELVRLLARI